MFLTQSIPKEDGIYTFFNIMNSGFEVGFFIAENGDIKKIIETERLTFSIREIVSDERIVKKIKEKIQDFELKIQEYKESHCPQCDAEINKNTSVLCENCMDKFKAWSKVN